MARNGSRGGGERVLESRHLVGLFLGVVLLCGVFFTLGYVMGRNQYGGSVHAAESLSRTAPSSSSKSREPETQPAAPTEWDFYPKKDADRPTPNARSSASSNAPAKPNAPAPAPSSKLSANDPKNSQRLQAPAPPKATILLQVAALRRQSDALEMADVIQQKKLPAFVVTPGPDNYYRVQVGPYSDMPAAEAAKRALEQLGFKPIIKH